MHSTPQSFQALNRPTRLAFELAFPDGTTTAFVTTGNREVSIGERYWNSYDGELYRVTNSDDVSVETVLEFGCGSTPRLLTVDRTWFTPDGHCLHHVTAYGE